MMMTRVLGLALIAIFFLAGAAAHAQDAKPATRGIIDPTQLVPDYNAPISNAQANEIFKECRGFYPRRFTPSALDYYCNCAAAATQGTMTSGEYASLQQARSRKPTNPIYQKYITNVIAPCMAPPTNDIEYMECMLDRKTDARVRDYPKYCQCVSFRMQQHVSDYGDVDIIISLSSNARINDPFEALWMSSKYREERRESKDICSGNFIPIVPKVTLEPENDMRKRREKTND